MTCRECCHCKLGFQWVNFHPNSDDYVCTLSPILSYRIEDVDLFVIDNIDAPCVRSEYMAKKSKEELDEESKELNFYEVEHVRRN